MKPKHQRLIFVAFSVVFLCAAALLTLQAFRDNLVFFYSPSELAEHATIGQNVRIGGLVETGSFKRTPDGATQFRLSDGKASVEVAYHGLLPGLFREGQGAVAEGHLTDKGHFMATQLLTKHDEKYMPREVVDALKRSGRWQEGAKPTP